MATGYYPSTCDSTIGEHGCDACAVREHGRVRGAGFIHENYYATLIANPNLAANWTNGLDIGTEGIMNIPEVEGELSEPSPVIRTGFGDVKDFLLGFDWAASFRDPNFMENCDFWNDMNNARGEFYFFYRTETQTFITDQPVTVIAKQIIENDIDSLVLWKVDVTWRSFNNPCNYTTIPILRTCWVNND